MYPLLVLTFVPFLLNFVVATPTYPDNLDGHSAIENAIQDETIILLKETNAQQTLMMKQLLENQNMMIENHARRLSQLEKRTLKGCEFNNKMKDDLMHMSHRIELLENQLNASIIENEDLKRQMVSLSSSRRATYEGETLNRTKRDAVNESSDEDPDQTPEPNSLEWKDKPTVAFDAYRNRPFHEPQSFITFDGTTINVGDAFNAETGKFYAPVKGVYSFTFHALTQDGTATYVKIVQNGRNVAGAYRRHEGEGDEEHQNAEAGLRRAEGMLAQHVLLELEAGDEVAVFAYHGNLRDGGWHYTHFTGFLI